MMPTSSLFSLVMDLAGGHINALDGLDQDSTWSTPCAGFKSAFGTSGGKYKAYNLGKGRGQSVFESETGLTVWDG